MNKGRPTKLTPTTQTRIEEALLLGATIEIAADYAGITATTYHNWRKRGREEADRRSNGRVKAGTKKWEREQPYFDFFEVTKRAIAQSALNDLSVIQTAAVTGTWQAAAWRLERRHNYRQQTDVTSGGETVQPIVYIKEDRSLMDTPQEDTAGGGG
jgi:hypothetical protein